MIVQLSNIKGIDILWNKCIYLNYKMEGGTETMNCLQVQQRILAGIGGMMKTKYLKVADGKKLGISRAPSFAANGSIKGMKEKYYGKDALLVRCGSWIYDCSGEPNIYHQAH